MATDDDLAVRFAGKYHVDKTETRHIVKKWRQKYTEAIDEDQFQKYMCEVYEVGGIKQDVLKNAFNKCVKGGKLDVELFVEWFAANMFTDVAKSGPKEESKPGEISKEMVDNLSEMGASMHDIEKIRRKFDSFDTDKSGAIDENEFRGVIKALFGADGSEIGEERFKRYYRELDTDGSGVIEFPEFLQWYVQNFGGGGDGSQCMKALYSDGAGLGDIMHGAAKEAKRNASKPAGSKER